MQYNIQNAGDKITVKITGRLTFKEHSTCRDWMKELSSQNGRSEVIDLSSLEFIDSAGLGLLLRIKEAAEKDGRAIALRVPNEGQVHKMLSVAEFEKMIPFES